MIDTNVPTDARPAGFTLAARLRPHLRAGVPGAIAVGLMLLWAEHDGGYDQDTWYWGALVLLAVLSASLVQLRNPATRLRTTTTGSRAATTAIGLFTAYVLWSYASIAWAASPGDALDGSNRALLYLIVFTLFVVLPWTTEAALAMLVLYALGVGVIALDIMYRLAATDQVGNLVLGGRLVAPTGYFNSSVALFMSAALLATALSVRRELPGLIRGALIAVACPCLQLALIGQSRGWLFTLPFVLLATLALVRNRFRFAAAALIPTLATLVPIHRLLDVFQGSTAAALNDAAARAGKAGLAAFAAAFVLGTMIAWGESLVPQPHLSDRARRSLGAGLIALALAVCVAGGFAATHGQPLQFAKRQLNGFTHEETGGNSSHFGTVGSGRYDFWRVALDAFVANPVGGLGQDNFADYYVVHRRTDEEPAWPHSLEMRLLACTGIVGFGLFVAFLIVAFRGALRAVREGPPFKPRRQIGRALRPAVAAAALLPLVDWLLHGSVDWFWEIPALSAPALGFLGMAVALGRIAAPTAGLGDRDETDRTPADELEDGPRRSVGSSRARLPRPVANGLAVAAFLAATVVLGFCYLSVREVSTASNLRGTDPTGALSDLRLAAQLNPLSADPGRLGGTIALQDGMYIQADQEYRQAVAREPGGWFSWFGDGLALSALSYRTAAAHALSVAESINNQQPAIKLALARVHTAHPLTPLQALLMIVYAG